MSGQDIQDHFFGIVAANRDAFLDDASEANLWNYAVSLHHVADYAAFEGQKPPFDRNAISKIAQNLRKALGT